MSIENKNNQKSIVQVAIDVPINKLFDYFWDSEELGKFPQKGMLVSVPFGKKTLVGIVIHISEQSSYELDKLKKVLSIAPTDAISEDLISMGEFAASYYQRPLGEVLVSSIPIAWRKSDKWETIAKPKRQLRGTKTKQVSEAPFLIELNEQQQEIIQTLKAASVERKFQTYLLQGITGSGKTLTYLSWLSSVLTQPENQVLIMVPEINLTPQLEQSIREAFPEKVLAVMHSGLTERTRADAWAAANTGKAQIILGTRMAIMASMPNLKAIVVDEEHDLSYKQQEGVRYSARDLAVWRAKKKEIIALLVSATPSLESWHAAAERKYKRLTLNERAAKDAAQPIIEILDLKEECRVGKKINNGIADSLIEAIHGTLKKGLQTLIFINRRGYSPVLNCESCGWLSDCTKCSAHMVLHKAGPAKSNLCCHHCGLIRYIPKACPDCGNTDLMPIGQGTQKVEQYLAEVFPQAKILRIDADSTKSKGSADELFGSIHDGAVDIVVGTQMIAKGHDYQSVGLVGVIDADASLFSQDYRAGERLFAQLMQVAGRAGRSGKSTQSRVIIQTRYPTAAPYTYLKNNNVDGFLNELCEERNVVGLPPFSYQALIHAEHRTLGEAVSMLKDAASMAIGDKKLGNSWPKDVSLSDVVPRAMMRVAGKERAQMLVESPTRQTLQLALELMQAALFEQNTKRKGVGWYIERDPIQI
jgi:primosomal protein N' (replication factor Y)